MSVQNNRDDLKIWYIKHYDFFAGINEEIKPYVIERTAMCSYKPGELIYMSGDEENVYLLKEGKVKVSRLREDGEEVIQDLLKPGEIFGSLPFLEATKNSETEYIQAATKTIVCIISRKNFEKLIEMHPILNQKLIKWYGTRMQRFEQRMNDLIFKDVKKRIAGFLLNYSLEFGEIKENICEVKALLTHEEIGLLVGAARQTVTSMLNKLRDDGLMEFNRKEWIIRDINALKKLSQ